MSPRYDRLAALFNKRYANNNLVKVPLAMAKVPVGVCVHCGGGDIFIDLIEVYRVQRMTSWHHNDTQFSISRSRYSMSSKGRA